MKVTKRMPNFEGVSASGGTATLRLPIGLSYEQLLITYAGVTLAQIDEIRVVGNGKVFQRFSSGTRLDDFNQFQGRAAASGVIVLDFTRYGMRTRAGEELTVLGTGAPSRDGSIELTTLALEIDINSAAVAPVLSCKAVQSAPQNLGLIRHIREYGKTATGSGELEISDIPKGHLFNQVHFGAAEVTKLRIDRDGFTVFERDEAENSLLQDDGPHRVSAAAYFVFDPTEGANGQETLQTGGVHDLRFIPTLSGAAALPILVDSIAPLA